jgi:hypothetical protein
MKSIRTIKGLSKLRNILIFSFFSLNSISSQNLNTDKTPKYIVRHYVEALDSFIYRDVIQYRRYLNIPDEMDNIYYHSVDKNLLIEMSESKYDLSKYNVKPNTQFLLKSFNDNFVHDNFEISNKVKADLDNDSTPSNAAVRRKGTINYDWYCRIFFPIDKGQSVGEVQEAYNDIVRRKPLYVDKFTQMINSFRSNSNKKLYIIGRSSQIFNGTPEASNIYNNRLALLRTINGINFFAMRYKEVTNITLEITAQLNTREDAIILSGSDKNRFVVQNSSITNMSSPVGGVNVNQAVVFRVKE